MFQGGRVGHRSCSGYRWRSKVRGGSDRIALTYPQSPAASKSAPSEQVPHSPLNKDITSPFLPDFEESKSELHPLSLCPTPGGPREMAVFEPGLCAGPGLTYRAALVSIPSLESPCSPSLK